MKKLTALILALCMACMLIPAMADASVAGTWYLSTQKMGDTEINAAELGISMVLTLGEDGSVSFNDGTGTWTMDGDQITITIGDAPISGTVTADSITLADEDMTMVFTHEAVETITLADVKPDAAAEEFYGEWTCTYVEAEGIAMNVSALGSPFPTIKLGEGTIEFVAASDDDMYALLFGMMGLTCTYEDGKLALASTLEGTSATGTVDMLTDGMLKFTIDMDGAMTFYCVPAAAAEEPAA